MTPVDGRTRLPHGVGAREFAEALAAFRAVLSDSRVLTSEAVALTGYDDAQAVLGPGHFAPSAALLPGTVEEVRQLLRLAGRHRIPLAPALPGRNTGLGGAAPRLPGAVVLDLSGLNRIVAVDATFGHAVVEPGVTFVDLAAHLAAHRLPYRLDPVDLGWGSVLGHALHAGGLAPYEDEPPVWCGLEVVLPDGELVRTGTGAVPGSRTGHLWPYGHGPSFDTMFAPLNLGVVTKLGVRLRPAPADRRPYVVTVPRADDLGPLVDALRALRADGTLGEPPVVRSPLLDVAAAGRRREDFPGAPGPVPEDAVAAVVAELGLGHWTAYGTLAGHPGVVDAQWAVLREALASIPGTRCTLGEPGEDRTAAGLWGDAADGWPRHGGHLAVTPLLPATGADALAQYRRTRRLLHAAGRDYLGSFVVGRRVLHHHVPVVFDVHDPDDRAAALAVARRLVARAAADGLGVRQAHPALTDDVAAAYGACDHALRRLGERVKDALDPAGVLAPGSHGLWPRRYRGLGL
ncbi:FAD-binding oxidoreductase [Streptomyces sp. NPDC006314]|uniref:FAD-binding oxidoreductase n=1 Tax=Streptomyces sp. NPDC006314 TaxID=3154475 RepID=UPI0033B73975